MCGIYASLGFAPERARIDMVAYRGPDGSGWDVYSSPAGPVALGHRRLSIIDLSSGGSQPMADPTGRFHIIFNGEIYNYIELRERLRQQGEVFTSDSDSEVLLRAVMVWGDDALEHLRGMFSFVIWDKRDLRLLAARDRYGIKPLYYVANEHGIAFASEIKQLLGLPGLSGRLNLARTHDFLETGITDHTPETMFDGVRQVRGGELASVNAGATGALRLDVRRWYSTRIGAIDVTEEEAGQRFRAALEDAVRLHLRSDVPVGSCLSGGLDSSSIVCLMADLLGSRSGGARVNTLSACYAEKSVDERPFMEAVAAHTRAIPHYIYPKAEDVFKTASDLTWHQDEPFGSTSIFAQWCVFEKAKAQGIKVMLDGQGADEQLAGYHSSFPYYLSTLMRRGQLAMLMRTIAERRHYHGLSARTQVKALVAPLLPSGLAQVARRKAVAVTRHDWLGTDLIAAQGNREGALALSSRLLDLPPVTDIRTLCLTLTFASNLQMLLHWEDRNSMAHSVEARVPFLDYPLVEFALALGNDHKIVGGDTKRVLRVAMAGVLPEEVRQRRDKLGFSTPEQIWFRGPLRELAQAGVEETLRCFPDLMNADGVRQLTADMLEGRRNLDFTLWRIINLGIWAKRFNVSL